MTCNVFGGVLNPTQPQPLRNLFSLSLELLVSLMYEVWINCYGRVGKLRPVSLIQHFKQFAMASWTCAQHFNVLLNTYFLKKNLCYVS